MPKLSSYSPLSASNLLGGIELLPFITVGLVGTFSDYICNGSSDEIKIQAAINSIPANGSGTVFVRAGTYVFGGTTALAFNGRKVCLMGEGIGRTIFTLAGSFGGGAMIIDAAATQGNIEVTGITFNMAGLSGVGGAHIYQCDNLNVHHCEFANQGVAVSHWGVRLGHYSDVTDLSSHNVKFCDNYIHDMNTGTNEQLLFVGQRDGFVQRNLWRNNSNSNAYEIMLYIDNRNVDVSSNTFENPSSSSIGLLSCQNNNIHDNQFNYSAGTWSSITNIQSSGTKISNNFGLTTAAGNAASFVNIFDRAVGGDGHTNIVPNSNNISITNNEVDGYKFGVGAQLAGTVLGTAYVMANTGITISGNQFRNMGTGGVLRLGVDDVTNTMNNVNVRNNSIYSWAGTGSTGAFFFTGYSTDATSMHDLYINNNFVAPSSGGSTVPAIRAISCTIADASFNSFKGTGGISTATAAVIARSSDSLGVNPNASNNLGTITGTVTVDVTNGSFQYGTQSGNVTFVLTAADLVGDRLRLRLITGGFTQTWPANFKKAGGSLVMTGTSTMEAEWDGSNWNEVSRSIAVS